MKPFLRTRLSTNSGVKLYVSGGAHPWRNTPAPVSLHQLPTTIPQSPPLPPAQICSRDDPPTEENPLESDRTALWQPRSVVPSLLQVKTGLLGQGSPRRLNRVQEREKTYPWNWVIFAPALLPDPPSKTPPKMLSEDARMTGSGSDRSFKGAEVEERVVFVFSNVLQCARRVTLTALIPTALTPADPSRRT
ncbi:hypothetical protein B0H10DRAFT_1947448 [Mycena sp. CBHHK59/15]|nr:hypothetical protein B0H10DRAFT_1947448 [Mycena sp. CBHHK59/15]